jgi:hypothetical protein
MGYSISRAASVNKLIYYKIQMLWLAFFKITVDC